MEQDEMDIHEDERPRQSYSKPTEPSIYPHEIKKAFEGLRCIASHMKQEDEEKKVEQKSKSNLNQRSFLDRLKKNGNMLHWSLIDCFSISSLLHVLLELVE